MDIDELNEEEVTTTINFKPSFVLIAIDTHPSMFETRRTDEDDKEETHPFKDALSACYEIADSLILASSRSNYNQFGVVLAENDQDKASLIEVENNLLDSVKLLKEKCSLSNEQLQSDYERKGDLDLGGFFRLCKKKFRAIHNTYYKRIIIFITNDDNPINSDGQKRFTALNEARTFEAGDIYFELVSMKKDFEYEKFYNELFYLYTKPPPKDILCEDQEGLVEQLQSAIVFRYTKLKYHFYPFKNDYSRYLQVIKMSFIRKAKLINTEKAAPDGRLLKRVRPDLGVSQATVPEFELFMGLQEPQLQLNLSDKYDIYGNDMPIGIHLQYVSDRQSMEGVVLNNTNIVIVDPKEELPYFEHFWQYCVDRNKVLICIKKYKHPTEIRYVELIPKYANNQKLFLIKDLPFSHELTIPKRILTTKQEFERTKEKSEVVRKLIDKLTFDYDPRMFINPSYGKKKAFVKAKLLDAPEEQVIDSTEDTQGIDGQIGEIVNEIKDVFGFQETQGIKRRAPRATGSTRGKKSAK